MSSRVISLLPLLCLVGCSAFFGTPRPGSEQSPGVHGGQVKVFHARHDFVVDVPVGAQDVDVWFAMPNENDKMQTIKNWQVESPFPTKVVHDQMGNNFLYMHLAGPPAGKFDVKTSFTLERHEIRADLDPARTRAHTKEELAQLAPYLAGSSQSVIDENARAMAREAVGNQTNPIIASRRIYDLILSDIEYHVKDPKPNSAKTMNATGKGSSQLCYSTRTGNCTDIHSLYAAVSRAAGIPTRAVYGSFFKGPLNGKDEDQSYHCWIEFHAPEIGWIPLDVAVADIFVEDFQANENSRPRAILTVADGYGGPDSRMVDYYFGNLDSRRVTWHWGRDLVMNPAQKGAPLLWNPKAYAEVNGVEQSIVSRKLTFHETNSGAE